MQKKNLKVSFIKTGFLKCKKKNPNKNKYSW